MTVHKFINDKLTEYYTSLGLKHNWSIGKMSAEAGTTRQNVYYTIKRLELWAEIEKTRPVYRKGQKARSAKRKMAVKIKADSDIQPLPMGKSGANLKGV